MFLFFLNSEWNRINLVDEDPAESLQEKIEVWPVAPSLIF